MTRRMRRLLISGGVAIGALALFYRWQPQRLQLFPPEVPLSEKTPRTPPRAALFGERARVLVVVAHPDDPEFYIGASLLLLHRAGATIRVIAVTDGDKAYYPPGFTDEQENRRVRRIEQVAASQRYGADVRFLGEPDGRLGTGDEVAARIAQEIVEFRPTAVMGFDPDYPPRIQHSDHVAAGVLTRAAIERAGTPLVHLMFSTRAARWALDTTSLWDEKRAGLAVHASQFGGEKAARIEGLVRGFDAEAGLRWGFGLAEGFRVVMFGRENALSSAIDGAPTP